MSKPFTTDLDDIRKRFTFFSEQTLSIKLEARKLYIDLEFPYKENAATQTLLSDLQAQFDLLEGVLTDEKNADPIRPLCEYIFQSNDWAKWKGPNIKLNDSSALVFIAGEVREMKRELASDDEKKQIEANNVLKTWSEQRIVETHKEHMDKGTQTLFDMYTDKKSKETVSVKPEPVDVTPAAQQEEKKQITPEVKDEQPVEGPVDLRVEIGTGDLNLKELESLGLVLRKIEPTVGPPPPDTFVTRAQNAPNIKLSELTFRELQEYQELLSALPEAQATWLASYDITQAAPKISKTQPFYPIEGTDVDGQPDKRDTNDDVEFQDFDDAYTLERISSKNVFVRQEEEQKMVDAASLKIDGGALLTSNPVKAKTDAEFSRLNTYATNWFLDNADPDLANHQAYLDESLTDDWTTAFTSQSADDHWQSIQDPQQDIAHWEVPVWKNDRITDAWEREIFNPGDVTLLKLPPWQVLGQE